MCKKDFFSKVYEIVKTIPAGKVTTYGLIAKKIGIASSARTVGWALNSCHNDSNDFASIFILFNSFYWVSNAFQ